MAHRTLVLGARRPVLVLFNPAKIQRCSHICQVQCRILRSFPENPRNVNTADRLERFILAVEWTVIEDEA